MVSTQQWQALLRALEQTSGVDVMAAPSVTTADGRQAQVSVTTAKLPAGSTEPVTVGPVIDLIPRLAADHQSVDLILHAQLNLLKEPPPHP